MKILNGFNRGLYRFLNKHPRFGIPRLMLYLIIGNALVFLFSQMDRSGMLVWYLCLIPGRLLKGEIWRLVTFVFVPNTSRIIGLVLELYFYYLIGSTLEQAWGTGKFTAYYLFGMALNIVFAVIAGLIRGGGIYVTGSYLNLSMFFVYATLWPENRILLFFFIPIKVKWLGWFEAALFILSMITGRTLLPLVAIANYFLFCGGSLLASLKLLKMRSSGSAVRFRRNVRRAEKAQSDRPYTRKCAVCGRTDADHPELEFRYCSQCVGYHCFCEDHIHSHVHFTEP
ncbi:MAG: rhomboid family intramembrane serine protease [Oscillospiraceae bacterium]|nr:rhomboid family intramembrane serine protease [Oscillospiraceae bacterium]